MESAHFFAMIHRMRYIRRWSLMRNTETENIEEHSLQVAVIAHALAEIRRLPGFEERPAVDNADVLLLAIYHDASEILTGDLPTPVKYFNPRIREAYQAVESVAIQRLLNMLPEPLRPAWSAAMSPDLSDPGLREAAILVKAADKLTAYIKCIEEKKAGNTEFLQAEAATQALVEQLAAELPEVRYFVDHFLPSYWLSLDELQSDGSNDQPLPQEPT